MRNAFESAFEEDASRWQRDVVQERTSLRSERRASSAVMRARSWSEGIGFAMGAAK